MTLAGTGIGLRLAPLRDSRAAQPKRGRTRAVLGACPEGIAAIVRDRDDHIIGLGDTYDQPVYFHRNDVLAIAGDNGNGTSCILQPEIGAGAAIDDTEAHAFAGAVAGSVLFG